MGKKPVKIVTIGGGSSYTPELMEGFIKRYDYSNFIYFSNQQREIRNRW